MAEREVDIQIQDAGESRVFEFFWRFKSTHAAISSKCHARQESPR